MNEVVTAFLDAHARIESIVHMASIAHNDGTVDAFDEFIDALPTDGDDLLFLELPFLRDLADAEAADIAWEIKERFIESGHFGLLVQGATCIGHNFRSDGSYECSWGHYHTRWFYAETLADAEQKVIAWAGASIEQDRAKAAACRETESRSAQRQPERVVVSEKK